MKRINSWKTIVFGTAVTLFIALQPAITFACEAASGHCGG